MTERDVCAEMRARCEYCGGEGEVHRMDGEWLGYCHCEYGTALRASEKTKRQEPPHMERKDNGTTVARK